MQSGAVKQSEVDLPASIGRFRPTDILGRGGQGVVYLSRDEDLGRQVAIKTLNRSGNDARKLLAEARNVANLDHPGIVPLFEINTEHEPPFLVYQFVSGRPLKHHVDKTNRLPVNDALKIIIDVLDAVGYAHEQGVLHRDLTPANILVDAAGHPRILDFGIATAIANANQAEGLQGTPNYMAPEVLAEKPPGTASDIFSVGVVLHELLSGRQLFVADNPLAVIYKILNEPVPRPSTRADGIDHDLDAIVLRALANDPGQRYATAADMREALTAYLAPTVPPVPPDFDDEPANDTHGTIAFLQKRMSRKPDFPAISKHICEINQKSGAHGSGDADELANVILQDFALTTKLLRVVNSAIYGQYGGSINTVSRAVIILGYEQVRALALGIVIFEHLNNGEQADLLKDSALQSFMSGLLAQELTQNGKRGSGAEEVFIASMMHRLGRHLAIYYFPGEYAEVQGVMRSKGVNESTAAREVLGVDYYAFGAAVGREWNLPDVLLKAMRPPPTGKFNKPQTDEERMIGMSSFCNELADVLSDSATDAATSFERLLEQYGECVDLDTEQLSEAVAHAIKATREYANILDVREAPGSFLQRASEMLAASDEEEAPSETQEPAAAGTDTSTLPASENDAGAGKRLMFLTDSISELTTAIVERSPINDMFAIVLEAFFRGLECTHVLLMLRDKARNAYTTRSGFGPDLETLKASFSYGVSGHTDLFSQAVTSGRPAVVIDTRDPRFADQIPAAISQQTNPDSLLLFPIMVGKSCIALIYADTQQKKLRINADEVKLLNTLVRQLSMGMRSH